MTNGTWHYEEYLEFTLAIGNLSSIYQMCYETVDEQVYDFYAYAKTFEKFTNYLLNLVPNLLSYSFLLSQWIRTIKSLDEIGDTVNLVYVYCVIIRKLFFYEYDPSIWNTEVTFDENGNPVETVVVNRARDPQPKESEKQDTESPKVQLGKSGLERPIVLSKEDLKVDETLTDEDHIFIDSMNLYSQ